eukprot:TRINITY_DN4657_c0_g1_i2.p1 TRINITY_DN4657_c0_g1~~TRINITY_DN4657_c0_g1_i2.p1  ORF type:complete len:318 (-),score=40.02 TRINITY_DN4657_c0_g1_i2:108-929(-)
MQRNGGGDPDGCGLASSARDTSKQALLYPLDFASDAWNLDPDKLYPLPFSVDALSPRANSSCSSNARTAPKHAMAVRRSEGSDPERCRSKQTLLYPLDFASDAWNLDPDKLYPLPFSVDALSPRANSSCSSNARTSSRLSSHTAMTTSVSCAADDNESVFSQDTTLPMSTEDVDLGELDSTAPREPLFNIEQSWRTLFPNRILRKLRASRRVVNADLLPEMTPSKCSGATADRPTLPRLERSQSWSGLGATTQPGLADKGSRGFRQMVLNRGP